MEALSQPELKEVIRKTPHWRLSEGALVRDFSFLNFVQAVAFVNQVASLAETQDHHPDIDIRYNKVRLGLVTHDANGITQRDIKLAVEIDTLAEPRA